MPCNQLNPFHDQLTWVPVCDTSCPSVCPVPWPRPWPPFCPPPCPPQSRSSCPPSCPQPCPPGPILPIPTPDQVGYRLVVGPDGQYILVPPSATEGIVNIPSPAMFDMADWNFDPTDALFPALSSEGISASLIQVTVPTNVSRVVLFVETPGEQVSTIMAAIYTEDGNQRLALTQNYPSAFNQYGQSVLPFTAPVNLQPGNYYVALLILASGSTPILYARNVGVTARPPFLSLPVFGVLPTATSLPSTLAPATLQFGSTQPFMALM